MKKTQINKSTLLFAASTVILLAALIITYNKNYSAPSSDNQWKTTTVCYKNQTNSSISSMNISGSVSQSNLFEISHLMQKTHTDLFNTYVDLEKRSYVAQKYKVKTFDGIPTYEEIFGDRLRISDVEIGEFLDKNPDLLSGAQATDREKRRAVRNYLYGTKIKEKKDEYLSDFKVTLPAEPFFAPCPPKITIPKEAGILVADGSSDKRIDYFVNPGEIRSRKSWTDIKKIMENNIDDYKIVVHLMDGDYARLETKAQCMIQKGDVAWSDVIKSILESPIDKENQAATIEKKLSKLSTKNEPDYKKCLVDRSKFILTNKSFKVSAKKPFKNDFRYASHVFINERLFIHFERGENPIVLENYLSGNK